MREVLAIARRELLGLVSGFLYWLVVLGIPLGALAVAASLEAVATRTERPDVRVALVDPSGRLAEAVGGRLGRGVVLHEVADPSPEALVALRAAGELDAWVVIPDDLAASARVTWHGDPPSDRVRRQVREGVRAAALDLELGPDAAPIRRILYGSTLEVQDLSGETGRAWTPQASLLALGGAGLLLMAGLGYAPLVVGMVLREKQAGLAEMMVAVVAPWKLMLGKVIGAGGAAVIHAVCWTAPELILGGRALREVDVPVPDGVAALVPGLDAALVLLPLYALHFLVSATVVAAAATLADPRGARLAVNAVIWLQIVGLAPLFWTWEDPHGPATIALEVVPMLTAPVAWIRFQAGAPAWQLGAAALWMVVCTGALARAAGRLYRVGLEPDGVVRRVRRRLGAA